MTAAVEVRGSVAARALSSLLLLGALLGFATFGTLPLAEGLEVAGAAVALAVVARLSRRPALRSVAPVPALLGLVALAGAAVPTAVAALYGGLTALALLVWLADDPDRLPGGAGRGLRTLGIPAAGFALAWASSFLLPGDVAPLGVAVALLVTVVAVVALLLRSPETFEGDAAATS